MSIVAGHNALDLSEPVDALPDWEAEHGSGGGDPEVASLAVAQSMNVLRGRMAEALQLRGHEAAVFALQPLAESLLRTSSGDIGFEERQAMQIAETLAKEFAALREQNGTKGRAHEYLGAAAVLFHACGRKEDLQLCVDMAADEGDPRAVLLFFHRLPDEKFKALALRAAYNIIHIQSTVLEDPRADRVEENAEMPAASLESDVSSQAVRARTDIPSKGKGALARVTPEQLLRDAALCVQLAEGATNWDMLRFLLDEMEGHVGASTPCIRALHEAVRAQDAAYLRRHGIPLEERSHSIVEQEMSSALIASEEGDRRVSAAVEKFRARFLPE